MIAVLDWVDGFGQDTYVSAICENVQQAQQLFPRGAEGYHPTRYQEIKIGEELDLDYYDAKDLFPKKKKKKKK